MTPPPLATIVMPLRRQQDSYLHQAVTSAALQTVPTAVLVVTSEATPASNLAILKDLAAEHPLLEVIQRKPGQGFADAINLGFSTADTDRVGLLLTDDWLSPHAVESCLHHDADIVSTGRIAYAADGVQTLWSRVIDQTRYDAIPTLEGKASALGHFLLFRRAAVLAVGGVDPSIGLTGADDYDLPWTLLEQGASVRLVAEPLYHYRDHDGERLTLRTQQDQVRDLRRILAKHEVGPEETERLVAAKSRWYGVPCHVAIHDPDWSRRPENIGRVRPVAIAPSPVGIAALHGIGEDLRSLVAELGSPPVEAEPLTGQPATTSRRASWKVRLEDGRILKARQLESTRRGTTLEQLSGLLSDPPFAAVLGRRGDALLEEWVPGPTLDTMAMTPDLAESVGLILGRVARAGVGNPLIDNHIRLATSLWQKLEGALADLRAAGAISADTCGSLLERARANAPDVLEAGLVHLDFKAQNLILTPAGPRIIDNELVDHGPLDMDLARTWYLWPMSAAQQARFLRGYGRMRSPRSFLLHEVFWAIHTLGCAAAFLHRHGLPKAAVLGSLDRLAAGELPRTWVGGGASARRPSRAEKVRLAFVCDYLAIGGQERICLELIRGLDRERFDPFLYAFRGGALEPVFRALGIPMLVGSARDPLVAERNWTAVDVAEKETYRATLTDALKRDRIDAALVFAWRDAIPAVQRAGVPVVIEKLDGPALVGKIVDKSGFDRVVAESATLRDAVIETAADLGLDEERVELIFPGIDLGVFDPSAYDREAERAAIGIGSDDLVVGTVCRLIPDKNVKLLLRSFAAVDPTSMPAVTRLLIVGPDGGALPELRRLADELGVADRVLFHPATDRVAAILSTMDVFAMTSLREGLPTAILEAMAMRLPIVTTGVGSIPEVMEGNGFLLPGYGSMGISQRLDRIFRDPPLRRAMGERSRAIAARFAIRHSVGRYEDLVLECLAEKPRAAEIPAGHWPAGVTGARPRVLVLNTRFKWTHIDYLVPLAKQVDLKVVTTREVHSGAIANARRWGLDMTALDEATGPVWEDAIRGIIRDFRPDVIHILYYHHEEQTVAVRRIIDEGRPDEPRPMIVFECRDPLTTLRPQGEVHTVRLERAAITAADGWIFVSDATRLSYEQLHGIDLSAATIVPHGFAERTVGPPAPKLSAADGRIHLALVGSAKADPRVGRYYPRIIRRLCQQGVVVHSYFHPNPAADDLHAALAAELPDYHAHAKLNHREETILSRAMSAYDLMGVFQEFDAPVENESRTMAVCMPMKAVCGWLLGGIPVVCTPHYRGLREWIDGYGMGFVIPDVDAIGSLIGRGDDIHRATRACLEHRHLLTHETQALRISRFYATLLKGRGARCAEVPPESSD